MRVHVTGISLTVKPCVTPYNRFNDVSGWFSLRLWLFINVFTLLSSAIRICERTQHTHYAKDKTCHVVSMRVTLDTHVAGKFVNPEHEDSK